MNESGSVSSAKKLRLPTPGRELNDVELLCMSTMFLRVVPVDQCNHVHNPARSSKLACAMSHFRLKPCRRTHTVES